MLAAWLATAWLPAGSVKSQPVATAPQLVLLENGGVLGGEVRLIDGFYVLTTDGGEIRLSERQVRFVESSLDRIVQRLRSEQSAPTVEDRLRLAAWCERQQLWGYAAQELIAAQRESPRDRRVIAAQRRLWHARELAQQAQEASSRPPAARRDEFVRPASFESPAQQPAADDLLACDDSLPPVSAEAVQEFTRHVQPILVNNCTTAGCHAGGGERSFQLNRDLLHGLASHRSTRMNLDAAVRALRASDPENSPLLLAMRPSHGGGLAPRRGYRWAEHQAKVADWVNLVVGRAELPSARRVERPEGDRQPGKQPEAASPPADVYAPGYYEALLKDTAEGTGGGQMTEEPAAPKIRRGVELKRLRERDEFDPEVFNQRFGDPRAAMND